MEWEKIGSGGWIRTSDQLINSQLRYHCATPELPSAVYYTINFAAHARGYLHLTLIPENPG